MPLHYFLLCISIRAIDKCGNISVMYKGYRIICATVNLYSDDTLYKVDSIMNNAMYLRTASQCVSILHSVTETMTFWYKKKWRHLNICYVT